MRRRTQSYSGLRLAQATWFVTSVYFGFMIAETTKDGLLPAVANQPVNWPRILLAIATLTIYFISAAEAYLWLNPKKDERLSSTAAAFRGVHLLIYVVAVIAHAFLYQPLREELTTESLAFWCRSFAALLFAYLVYNIVWAIKRALIEMDLIEEDRGNPTWDEIKLYIIFYALFVFAFWLYALQATTRTDRDLLGHTIATLALFLCYHFGYFMIWWKSWHQGALGMARSPAY